MQRYRVQISYRVDLSVPTRDDMFAASWGPGLRRSRVDGGILLVVATVKARSPQVAAHLVDLRVQHLWQALGHDSAVAVMVDVRAARALVVAGRVIGGRRLLTGSIPRFGGGPGGPGDQGGDDEDGGLAGVREPRRPCPAPPSLSMALDEPRP